MKAEEYSGHHGSPLTFYRLGTGRPLILLHGLFSSAEINWIKYGTAARLIDAGFEVIMPDLRAHGASAAPHDPSAYPPDVLVHDLKALITHLGLTDYNLGGFSLGARTCVRAVQAGLSPRRLVLGGMGYEGLTQWSSRSAFFIDVIDRFGTIERGDPAWFAQAFLKSTNVDQVAARLLLQSLEGTAGADLDAIAMPTLVVCGDQDHDNGSAERLAKALPDAKLAVIPGTHMSSVTQPQLGEKIAEFLAD